MYAFVNTHTYNLFSLEHIFDVSLALTLKTLCNYLRGTEFFTCTQKKNKTNKLIIRFLIVLK